MAWLAMADAVPFIIIRGVQLAFAFLQRPQHVASQRPAVLKHAARPPDTCRCARCGALAACPRPLVHRNASAGVPPTHRSRGRQSRAT